MDEMSFCESTVRSLYGLLRAGLGIVEIRSLQCRSELFMQSEGPVSMVDLNHRLAFLNCGWNDGTKGRCQVRSMFGSGLRRTQGKESDSKSA